MPAAPLPVADQDETSEKMAYIDIPLSFVSESPEVPEVGDTKKEGSRVHRKNRRGANANGGRRGR